MSRETASWWRQVHELFTAALEQPPDRRDAYLLEAAGDNAALRDAVRALLDSDAAAETVIGDDPAKLLDLRLTDLALLLDTDGPAGAAHGRIGPYRIIREAGRGGMAAVYLAEREVGGATQRVAVKLLDRGIRGEDLIRRFVQETQVLASLEHPHIARFYDAGATPDGAPYLVMEYVDGSPLTVYCDERRLNIGARLELFTSVCRAVQYAHQRLVVHRDIKPSNILVTNDGVVKLLDFGIAKLLADEPDPAAPRTRTGFRLLTPEYAAPEQLRGEAVSTAADVYSLGLVLCELLAGRRPREVTGTGRHDATASAEPLAPSTAVQKARREATADAIAAARDTTSERLRRALAGDLDNIVLKALEAEPERRYQSAEHLADELARHRAGLPVLARPATLRYRVRKYVRRHRGGVLAGLAVALALIGGSGAALWQAGAAARERDAAKSAAIRAERVTDFLVEIFEAPAPGEAPTDSLTARQVLDRGRRRIEHELDVDPAMQAALMGVMARTYISLGDFASASELAEAGLERIRRVAASNDPELATNLVTAGEAALSRGDPVAADSFFRQALSIQEAALGPAHPDLAVTLVGLAATTDRTIPDSAESLLRRALRVADAGGDERRRLNAASVMTNLGLLLHQRHQPDAYEEAERLYDAALAIERDVVGDLHPRTLAVLSNTAWLRMARGDYEGAARAHREILEARRRVLGPRHFRVALTLNALAEAVHNQGDYEAAVTLNREALSIRSELFPEDHVQVLYSLHMLALALASAGDGAAADSLYREGLARARRAGLESIWVARMVNDYGTFLERQGSWEQAEAAYREAWRLYRVRLGEEHPFTGVVQMNVAAARRQRGDLEAAESLQRDALEVMRNAWSDDHPSVAAAAINLAETVMDRGGFIEAEPLLREGLAVLERALPDDHWRIAVARSRLGGCLTRLDRHDEAEELLLASYGTLSEARDVQRTHWLDVIVRLAELYQARGDAEQAAIYRELLAAES